MTRHGKPRPPARRERRFDVLDEAPRRESVARGIPLKRLFEFRLSDVAEDDGPH
jgi:hypothetical protein